MRKYWMTLLCVLMAAFVVHGEEEMTEKQEETVSPPVQAEVVNPKVEIITSSGRMTVELNAEKAPGTVDNFLAYVDSGFYTGLIFHRVIPGFMIQGGGFDADMGRRDTRPSIQNEAGNGLKNMRGTLAMARTPDPHSASSQFFINLVDNDFLNYQSPNPRGFGYCVFGEVVEGMDVVDAIAAVRTGRQGPHQNVPVEPVVIESISRVDLSE